MEDYRNKLEKQYKNIFELDKKKPSWAVKKKTKEENIYPAIPFVGKSYTNTKLLLYASAENLTYYEQGNDNWLDNDATALYRRDISNGSFFPKVHISPVQDGSLLIVAAYILKKLGIHLEYSNPFEFIENIAVDNFGKFSIKTEKEGSNKRRQNVDYAKNIDKIRESFDYIKSDLKILKPEILILPRTIYFHDEVNQLIKSILPECLVLPIYQINSGIINRLLAKKYEKKSIDDLEETLIDWQSKLRNGITGKTNENFRAVYTYLDKIHNDYCVK